MNPIVCDICSHPFVPSENGQSRLRKSCEVCYTLSRRADNIVSSARYRSKGASNLDRKFVVNGLLGGCAVLKIPFELEKRGLGYKQRHPLSPSIDRIDPDGGYIRDNVRFVCWWYNLAKARYRDEEVLEFCKLVVSSSNTDTALTVGPPTQ